MKNIFDLTNKVTVITGAASGIGYELIKTFLNQGAKVAALDINEEGLNILMDKLAAFSDRIIALKCNVTKENDVECAVNSVLRRYERIDILINNAGIASMGAIENLEESEWDKTIDVNLKGVFLMSKHVVRYMKESGYGKIINLASMCGIIGNTLMPLHAYNASKGAVINLTRGMAASLASHGITVNAIGPGLIRTKMTEKTLFQEDFLNIYNKLCPTNRPGEIEELTGAMLYFASDASSYTTGQTLFIDGGFTSV